MLPPPRSARPPPDDDNELPRLTPAVVEDEEDLAAALETFRDGDADQGEREAEIGLYEDALRQNVQGDVWQLAVRLLGLLRAAADERLLRMVRWAFNEGRAHPWFEDPPA